MSGKKALIMAVLLVAVVALMAGCTGGKTAKTGDNVSVDYILTVGDNTSIVDTSYATVARDAGIYDLAWELYEPLSFVIGDEQYLPGFENGVIGMKVGETKNVTVDPADAYGDYDPSYIQPVNMSDLVAAEITPYVNQTIPTIYGNVRVDRIELNETDYNSSIVYIDFNPPLAGKTLHFQITLRSVEAPTVTPTPKV
jgi:FKBP-type peptidyl-prolyl cis-trans isomerase 2